MVLGTATQRRTFLTSKWFFDNNVLEQVEDYTYLDINIHCSGSYKQILRVLHSKALRVYHGLFKSFSNIDKTLNSSENTYKIIFIYGVTYLAIQL